MESCASHSKGVLYYRVDVCNRARDLNRSIADTESVCSDSLFIDVSKILEHDGRSPQADPLTPNALLNKENDVVLSEERPSRSNGNEARRRLDAHARPGPEFQINDRYNAPQGFRELRDHFDALKESMDNVGDVDRSWLTELIGPKE